MMLDMLKVKHCPLLNSLPDSEGAKRCGRFGVIFGTSKLAIYTILVGAKMTVFGVCLKSNFWPNKLSVSRRRPRSEAVGAS